MKSIRVLTIGFAAAALMCATSVRANFITIGDPVEIGSWVQGFNESEVGQFTQVETIFVSGVGGPFETPGYTGLASGWTVGSFNANHVIATGPSLNNMTWNIDFLGAPTSPLVFDFYAWNGNVLAEKVRATWNGGAWSFNKDAAVSLPGGPTPVPEPTTMIAGALLLLPFGVSTLRIMRKNRAA